MISAIIPWLYDPDDRRALAEKAGMTIGAAVQPDIRRVVDRLNRFQHVVATTTGSGRVFESTGIIVARNRARL